MLPVEGNGGMQKAIRMLQRKVRQLDEELAGGDPNHPFDTEEELNAAWLMPETHVKKVET